MKLNKWAALIIAIGLLAVGAQVTFGDLFGHAHAALSDPMTIFTANAALLAMRSQHADLVTRAAAKLAEVKDGLPPADVTRIESEHAELVRQASEMQTKITAEETRAPPAPAPQPENRAHSWTTEDIGRINARATAFGLTAADAITVMGEATIRTVEQATDRLQNLSAERAPSRQNNHVRITQDEGDTIRTAVEASIVLRANPQGLPANAPEREMARNYRGMSLMEVGRTFLEESRGVKLRGLSKRELATVLLGLDTRAAGMHSTSDFANLLANVAAKRLRAAYDLAPQSWKRIGRQSNNPDFKAKSVVQLSAAPAFKQVREGQEYSYGGLTDGVEQYALATYGRIIAITRQTLINDDLSAFDRLPMLLGRAAADLEATTFWNVLLNNAAMSDTVALFHATHGNLLTGSAVDETNLALAEKALRDQRGFAAKSADREYLNLTPRFLVTGSAYKVSAQKMLTAVQATATSGVNVFAGTMELIAEARVTGNKWFTVADPATIDTVEYAYLEGEEGVFTEQRVGFEVDGIEIKGRLDFAAKAIDWRGMTYNPGA